MLVQQGPGRARSPNVVIEKKEIYGDELVRLLNGANLQIPERRPDGREGLAGPVNVARSFRLKACSAACRALRRGGRSTHRRGEARPRPCRRPLVRVAAVGGRVRAFRQARSSSTSRGLPSPERQAAGRRTRGRPRAGLEPIQLVAISRTLTPAAEERRPDDVQTPRKWPCSSSAAMDHLLDRRGEAVGRAAKVLGREALGAPALYTLREYISEGRTPSSPSSAGAGAAAVARVLLSTKDALSSQLHDRSGGPAGARSPALREGSAGPEAEGVARFRRARRVQFRVEQGQSGVRVLVLGAERLGLQPNAGDLRRHECGS